jgi:predicted alpha-1,2-mannosidase
LLGRHGYYPFDLVPDESVSRTLEHGVDDDAASRLFRLWGEVPESEFFARRAQNYRQLWDTATQLLRGRSSAGGWRTPFDSLTATSPLNNPGDYTEANAMQYLWTPAQYDHEGLVELLGDSASMERKLDRFFAVPARNPQRYLGQEAMMGQYAHGNEPSHHVAYLYALVGRPDKTAERVAKICADFYRPRPDGLIGNDDCGQMSAWYLLSTLGFYPVNPSNATYVLGAMQVQRAVITRPEGRIRLRPHPEGIHVNGRLLQGPVVAHRQLFGQP